MEETMACYGTHNSSFTSGFFTFISLMVFCSVVKGQNCNDSEFLKEKSGKYLRGHVKETFQTETASLCRVMCYLDGVCMSYNYHHSTGDCEINNSDHIQYPDDLINKTGYSYIGRKNKCENKPCHANAICKADFHNGGFECLPAALGSRERPAKSCLDILNKGFSNGSGVYVLHLPNTSKPIEAYCDMKTDGGGWTKVKRLYLEASSLTVKTLYYSYEVLAQYNNNSEDVVLTTSAMLDIYQKMGFHQIHFYCYKKSVGRVVSIMTKNNTSGNAVVKFFINDKEPVRVFPTACGSFDRLPEDTSILSQNCSLWGKRKSGTIKVNKWGSSNNREARRISNYPFGIEGDKTMVFSFYERFRCDDNDPSVSIRDTWQISVR